MNPIGEREAAIAQIAESDWIDALRNHVHEIVEGEAFRGSHRSAQFLNYIIDQALACRFESLKERMIGIELFGRSPSYHTSDDAIVRVTASDVRKRLLQHYGKYGSASEFRITLPLGTYIPEIAYEPHLKAGLSGAEKEHADPPDPGPGTAPHPETLSIAKPAVQAEDSDSDVDEPVSMSTTRGATRRWVSLATLLVALNLALWAFLWKHPAPAGTTAPPQVLPWSAFFSSAHPTHVITSDPDFFAIKILTHSQISVSDYANHHYLPEHNTLSPELKSICENLLAGDKASNVDAEVVAKIAALAKSYSHDVDVEGARSLQFSDLRTDDNFIFLGSPASNPWFSVFEQQLDFRFLAAQVPGGGFIRNLHPTAKEAEKYVPTARGGATGETFALVAFVDNPEERGQVLLLAGLDREGTQAAGYFVTDPVRLTTALRNCGIPSASPPKHFEILLRVDTMAGSPSQFGVVTCHVLQSAPAA